MRKYIILILVLCVAVGGAVLFSRDSNGLKDSRAEYKTAKLETRDLVKSISATGTLSAVVTVDVGSQISGQISKIMVDYNSPVKKDQIIARIDPLSHEALVRQSRAEVELYQAKLGTQKASVSKARAEKANSESNLLAAKAAVAKAKATFKNAELNLKRSQNLVKKDFIAKTDFDQDQTEYHEAKAQLEQAKAQVRAAQSTVKAKKASLQEQIAMIKEAEAQVRLKKASLDNRKVDLDHTIIRSPVDGVIIDRAVDVGQTVAASLSAPVLFTIAQDLKDMEVAASVDESDIGSIREGQSAYFTVDAYGARKFTGKVKQIRKASKTVQNVVTYTVVIAAANHDLSLMPGMTADVRIVLQERKQVLAAPNKALRFQPPEGAKVEDSGQAGTGNTAGGSQAKRRPGQQMLARLSKALELSDDQQQAIREDLAGLREKSSQKSGQPPMGPGAGSRQRAEMRKKMELLIMRNLTPDQRDKYANLAKQRNGDQPTRGTLYTLNQQGELKALGVMVGVGDGSYSEVRGRNLEKGLLVVTGRK